MNIETPLQWADVLADPSLRDLPYKIELNGQGKIEMSPASNQYALVQARLAIELSSRAGGTVLTECSVQTSDGVRVPDVAWISDARLARYGLTDPLQIAPEICVEVKSPSNSTAEMLRKAQLYFEAGASEVWVVALDGQRQIHQAPTAAAPP